MIPSFRTRWHCVLIMLAMSAVASADDIRPDSEKASAIRPHADESCIEKCDTDSDQCMADSEGDPDKLQVCDEKYSACLQACEGG